MFAAAAAAVCGIGQGIATADEEPKPGTLEAKKKYAPICATMPTARDLEWIIDMGASYHATPRREFFATYRSRNFGVVKMGNHDTADIIGMGDIHIKTNLGCKLVLKDMRHMVDLRLNLISVGRLDDEDYDSRLQAKAYDEQLNDTEKDFSMELWHRRLGHMSEKGLQALSKREVLPDLRDQGSGYWSYGIQHEMIVPSTPQHNAIAERMNRTIMEKIRSLDAVVAEHVWSRKDVSYRHLRVFNCHAFAHIPDNERSKLDGIAASQDLEVEQLDMKTIFFHGDLEEKIYMEQPEGFKVKDMHTIDRLKKELSESFVTKDMGPAKQILGIQISRDRKNKKIWLSREKYIEKALERFSMSNAKPVGSPLRVTSSYAQNKVRQVMKRRRKCKRFLMLQQLEV
ncbi:Retrotransposon protein [Musa troglodytarum]|uniref:Retrotransposon protein n=1 Tax=Musa troglodytarum TaxID=320322 RepID=A0A9E7FHW5_9LILI|nr:Retrotransposon protein [Musa troglodytarum]